MTIETLNCILLVDDDTQDAELTLTALTGHSISNEVVVARDGVEALDYLYRRGKFTGRATDDPTVILLDLKMPKLDGVQVLQQIKSDEHLRHIPVVMLTSSREAHDLDECYKLGANAYVVKPVHFAEFIEAVGRAGVFWALVNEQPPSRQRKV